MAPPKAIMSLAHAMYVDGDSYRRVGARRSERHVGRRFYKNWHTSKQKAFTKYQKRWSEAAKDGNPMDAEALRVI